MILKANKKVLLSRYFFSRIHSIKKKFTTEITTISFVFIHRIIVTLKVSGKDVIYE